MELLLGADIVSLVRAAGYAGVFAIVFAESGLLLGFLLPGDSLLFTAGFLASRGYLHIGLLIAGCFLAAVAGDNTGYLLGASLGPRVFRREKSIFFNPRNVEHTRSFYARYGRMAIILARFLPVVRAFTPALAGVGGMPYWTFFLFDLIGGALWAIGLPVVGYSLGSVIPGVDRYLLPIVLAIIAVSLAPSVVHVLREPETRSRITAFFKRRYDGGNGGEV